MQVFSGLVVYAMVQVYREESSYRAGPLSLSRYHHALPVCITPKPFVVEGRTYVYESFDSLFPRKAGPTALAFPGKAICLMGNAGTSYPATGLGFSTPTPGPCDGNA